MPYKLNPITGKFDYYENDNQTLENVLSNNNTSGPYDIDFDAGQGLIFDNGSRLKEGTTDGGLGGNKGIAEFCSIGYEKKWEAGRLYIMEQDGFTIRSVLFQFNNTPTITDDITLGYIVGSRWILDNGTIYVCTNNTLGAAVWELEVNEIATILKTKVVNKTSPAVTLSKAAYQVCLISGAQGQRLAVRLAKGDSDANSAGTLGIASETILINQEGFITSVGLIEDINTTGSLQGETWADGDILYLSPTTFGAITNIKPVAPNHTVIVGYVEYAHAIHGKIYVKIDNGYELNELHNVDINTGTLANNDGLFYNTATSTWQNKTVTTALGFTPVTNARTITINGSAQNLTADRSWNTYAIVPVQSVVSAATVTPTSTNQLVIITAQAAGLTLANPTGAFVEGQPLMIRIKDNGTARAINYDTNYRAIGVTLPTTTVINKTTYLGIIYNAVDGKWDVIGVTTQA